MADTLQSAPDAASLRAEAVGAGFNPLTSDISVVAGSGIYRETLGTAATAQSQPQIDTELRQESARLLNEASISDNPKLAQALREAAGRINALMGNPNGRAMMYEVLQDANTSISAARSDASSDSYSTVSKALAMGIPTEEEIYRGPGVRNGHIVDAAKFAEHWGYDVPALTNFNKVTGIDDPIANRDLGVLINARKHDDPANGARIAHNIATAGNDGEVAAASSELAYGVDVSELVKSEKFFQKLEAKIKGHSPGGEEALAVIQEAIARYKAGEIPKDSKVPFPPEFAAVFEHHYTDPKQMAGAMKEAAEQYGKRREVELSKLSDTFLGNEQTNMKALVDQYNSAQKDEKMKIDTNQTGWESKAMMRIDINYNDLKALNAKKAAGQELTASEQGKLAIGSLKYLYGNERAENTYAAMIKHLDAKYPAEERDKLFYNLKSGTERLDFIEKELGYKIPEADKPALMMLAENVKSQAQVGDYVHNLQQSYEKQDPTIFANYMQNQVMGPDSKKFTDLTSDAEKVGYQKTSQAMSSYILYGEGDRFSASSLQHQLAILNDPGATPEQSAKIEADYKVQLDAKYKASIDTYTKDPKRYAAAKEGTPDYEVLKSAKEYMYETEYSRITGKPYKDSELTYDDKGLALQDQVQASVDKRIAGDAAGAGVTSPTAAADVPDDPRAVAFKQAAAVAAAAKAAGVTVDTTPTAAAEEPKPTEPAKVDDRKPDGLSADAAEKAKAAATGAAAAGATKPEETKKEDKVASATPAPVKSNTGMTAQI